MRLDGQTWLGRWRWVERRRRRRNNRRWRTWRRRRRGGIRGRTERRWRYRWLRAESGLVSRLRARHRRVLRRRLPRRRLSSAGWRSGRVWIGRRVRQRRHRRSWRYDRHGRPRWRRRRRGRTRRIGRRRGRHGWSSRCAGHALAPAARSACDRAAAERPCPVFLFPMAVSVRADTHTVRSAPTSERRRVRVPAASRHRALHLLPIASRSPRRAAAP